MSNNVQLLVGRILLSIIFILSGFSKLTAVSGTAGYMASMGIPAAGILVWVVIALEFLGGIAILIGFKTKYVAWALAAFCILSGMAAHMNFADQIQMIMFMKNLAMAGGFLVLAAAGAGAYSVDARTKA